MTAAGEPNVSVAANGTRRIVLCADDYGISPAVNVAIRDLIVRGRLSATSVMVTAPAFDRFEAAALDVLNASRQRVAIGLHFTLTAPYRPLSAGFAPLRDGAFLSHARHAGGEPARTLAARRRSPQR